MSYYTISWVTNPYLFNDQLNKLTTLLNNNQIVSSNEISLDCGIKEYTYVLGINELNNIDEIGCLLEEISLPFLTLTLSLSSNVIDPGVIVGLKSIIIAITSILL